MLKKLVEKMYRARVYSRADDTGCVFYFSKEDFPSLKGEEFVFQSSLGHKLAGSFYWYDGYNEDRLIMFEHGMGSGHRGYMAEIERLCRAGYRVFSYDHTGCMKSGGETTGGFAQSLRDFDDAVKALKADERYKNLALSVVGHSWGGFSALNSSALHPEIEKVVAMSGFVSVDEIVKCFFRGILSSYGKMIMEIERKSNPEYIKYNAVDTLKSTKAEVLVIHSDDDQTVLKENSIDILERELKGKENITFLRLNGKNHNPNYTEDAVKYMGSFFADLQKNMKKLRTDEEKKNFRDKYDWKRMTAQDEKVWEKIISFLE